MLSTCTLSSRSVRVLALMTPHPNCTTAIVFQSSEWSRQMQGSPYVIPSIGTPSPALRYSYTTVPVRNFHGSVRRFGEKSLKPSSQVEVTVKDLKEKEKDKLAAKTTQLKVVQQPTLIQRIKDEIIHYYHGFKLLFIDVRISSKYLWRTVNGDTLSRREYRQLIRTTSDLFRLVPFSVFIIIPFMEILLPVALKLFPGMLPSTFETANEKDAKMKKTLKVKLEMAKFLQQTLDNMAVEAKGHRSENAKNFVEFFEKVRKSGEPVSIQDVMKFSKVFEDELTLDSLSRPQLTALCRLLEMQPFGTNNFLRFQLRMKLRALVADDKIIQREGIESLAVWELQQACRARGMRAYGMTEERLQLQLKQWLDLSLNEKVPQSLLLLSRTLYLPENIPTTDTLAATISALPEEVATRTKAAIGKKEGKIDNVTRLEVIKAEEKKIEEDKQELQRELESKKLKEEAMAKKKIEEEEKRKEESMRLGAEAEAAKILDTKIPEVVHVPSPTTGAMLAEAVEVTKATVTSTGEIKAKKDVESVLDVAEVLEDKAKELNEAHAKVQEEPEITAKDLKDVEEAIETLGVEKKKLLLEEKELLGLKTELADYEEDIEDFKQAISKAGIKKKGLKESKAARRLFSKVNKMINRLEPIIDAVKVEERSRQEIVEEKGDGVENITKEELLDLQELSKHMHYISSASDTSKIQIIMEVLSKMDDDQDGAVKIDHVLKVLDMLSEGQIGISKKMLEDVIVTLSKEDQLETQTLIQRALKLSKDNKLKKNDKPEKTTAATNTKKPEAGPSDVSHTTPIVKQEKQDTVNEVKSVSNSNPLPPPPLPPKESSISPPLEEKQKIKQNQ